ncbi:MAG: T9SS C-terminal target domain-containing protein [Saprospirales bacterium]|nr:MAG: T9SS C-terminal target domain-containing protein [Saprospirales bacterium]
MQSYSNHFGDITTNEKRDTGSWTINPGQLIDWELVPGFFDHIPGEPIITTVEDHSVEIELFTLVPAERSTFNQRELILHSEYLHESPENDCEYTFSTAYDRLVYNNFYIEGMGGGYHRIYDHPGTSIRKPVYVSTADLEWGEPFEFTVHTMGLGDQQTVLLYPNPVRSGENLRLEAGEIKAEAYNIYRLGKKVKRGNIAPYSGIQEIETGSLNSGFYHVELEVENGQVVIKRIVVLD